MGNTSSIWTSYLNPEQQEAAQHDFGPLLILAGAGSGKTTVLVSRTGRLIAEEVVKPEQITVLTFTNKSAKELKARVAEKLGSKGKKIWAGTFHSFGLSILKEHYKEAKLPKGFGIIDAGDSKSIIRDLLKSISHYAKENFDEERILNMIGDWREREQKYARDDSPDDEYEEIVQMILPKYIRKLELLGVVDFQSLLVKPLEVFRAHPHILEKYQSKIKQLMVDEFQDTNTVQMKLILELVKEHKNITVVGDDDQSIYGWRGADVSNILNFPRRFEECKVVRLQRNYRSTAAILNVANHVIKKNIKRHDKVLKAEGYDHSGNKPEVFAYNSEEDEAKEMVGQIHYFGRKNFKYKDIAILYRSNSQGAFLESELRHNNIPYILTGGTAFFERREVKDVLAYIQCAFAPNEISIRRVINTPSRGVGDKTIEAFEKVAIEKNVGFYELFRELDVEDLDPRLKQGIYDFKNSCINLKELLLNEDPLKSPGERLLDYLDQVKYRSFVFNSYKDSTTAQKRWALIEIFSRVLDGFMKKNGETRIAVRSFIETMQLRDQLEEQDNEKNDNKVQLMTFHACKGLEFPVVLMIGLEEEVIPHKTLGLDIDEERRLFYVGLTRAKEHLVLSRALERKRYGKLRPSAPSRFLLEIPEEMVVEHAGGFRPLASGERTSMLADLYKKLDQKSAQKQSDTEPE